VRAARGGGASARAAARARARGPRACRAAGRGRAVGDGREAGPAHTHLHTHTRMHACTHTHTSTHAHTQGHPRHATPRHATPRCAARGSCALDGERAAASGGRRPRGAGPSWPLAGAAPVLTVLNVLTHPETHSTAPSEGTRSYRKLVARGALDALTELGCCGTSGRRRVAAGLGCMPCTIAAAGCTGYRSIQKIYFIYIYVCVRACVCVCVFI
jgi:hypothetical protein